MSKEGDHYNSWSFSKWERRPEADLHPRGVKGGTGRTGIGGRYQQLLLAYVTMGSGAHASSTSRVWLAASP